MGVEDRLGSVAFDRAFELLRDFRERIVPGDGFEAATGFRAAAPKRALEPRLGIAPDSVVGECAFLAELAAADGMIRVAEDPSDSPSRPFDDDSAAVVTVSRAGSPDSFCHGQASVARAAAWPGAEQKGRDSRAGCSISGAE